MRALFVTLIFRLPVLTYEPIWRTSEGGVRSEVHGIGPIATDPRQFVAAARHSPLLKLVTVIVRLAVCVHNLSEELCLLG